MFIRIGFEIVIDASIPTTLILALSPHSSFKGRVIGSDLVRARPEQTLETFIDPFGNRLTRLTAPKGELVIWSDCVVEVDAAPDPYDWNAEQHAVADLPPETLPWLTASRYCGSDSLVEDAWRLFGSSAPGWARVQAICNFVHGHLTFGYQYGRSAKTASDALRERTGVCRDFAQLSVALCRAMSIPARYASGYLGDIGVPYAGPADFCAWFEVYLGGRWWTFDARYNTPRIGRVLMVRGRDAADGAMITSFGSYELKGFKIWTQESPEPATEAEREALFASTPDVPPLIPPPAPDAWDRFGLPVYRSF